jgi:hypothetical protein
MRASENADPRMALFRHALRDLRREAALLRLEPRLAQAGQRRAATGLAKFTLRV